MDRIPRIFVTGMGAVSSLGIGVEALWDGLKAGASGIGPITLYDTTDYLVKIAGEVPEYETGNHFERKAARRLGRYTQFTLLAAAEALEGSGLDLSREDPTRFATIVGSGIGDFETIDREVLKMHRRGSAKLNPFTVPRVITNMAAANLAIEYGLTGPSFGLSSACATGSHALATALHMLRSGLVEVAFVGAAEACLSPGSVEPYQALRALSSRDVDPKRASCPFDRERDGFVIAEGAGILLLETEAHARARGAPILAELAGAAMTCDAHHITACAPNGGEAARAMRLATADAGLDITDIDYVSAHGTSTPLNDPAETRALKTALGDRAYEVPVSSIKSMIGHTLGASGAVQAVAAVKTLNDGILPPTINLDHPDPECDLDYVPNEAREVRVKTLLSNSFGFGGQNGVLVFRAAEEARG